jgi:hypothetical protein
MGKFQLRSKGGPTMDNGKSHGTNMNYKKSGMNNADGSAVSGEGAPFLGKIFKGAKKLIGGAAKFGAFGPLGMMAQKMMAKRKAAKAAQNANTDQPVVQGDTGVPTDPIADANAPIGSEGAMVPNQEELQTN